MPHSKYLDPQLADGLQLMQALTGDNDLTQDLPAARAAANARDERLLANMNLPESLAKSVETARASDGHDIEMRIACLLYTSPSPRDRQKSRMPSSA